MVHEKRFALILSVLIVLTLVFLRGKHIIGNLCVNYEFLQNIHNKTKSYTPINDLCKENLKNDEDLIWWQGYSLWQSGFNDEAINKWQLMPKSSVERLIATYKLNNFSEHNKISLLKNGLHISVIDNDLAGKVSWLIISELGWKTAYELFYREKEISDNSPVINASLAYVSTKYNPEGISSRDLFMEAYNNSPDNYHVLLFGFRLYLEDDFLERETILEMVERGEKLYGHELTFAFNLASVYKKLGNYSKAYEYSYVALLINPSDPKINLLQIELAYLTNADIEEQWVKEAFQLDKDNSPYSISYFQRLIWIFATLGRIDEAQLAFCKGLQFGFSPDELIIEDIKHLMQEFPICETELP